MLVLDYNDRVQKEMQNIPLSFYHLDAGRVTEGAPADLILFDPKASWTVQKPFVSRSSNSPFLGEKLPGIIRYTIAGGEIIYEDIPGNQATS